MKINLTATEIMLGAIGSMVGMGGASALGGAFGAVVDGYTVYGLFTLVFVPLVVYGLVADSKDKEGQRQRLSYRRGLYEIAQRHNAVTRRLEHEYELKSQGFGYFGSRNSEGLRDYYEAQYYRNKDAYERECRAYLETLSLDTETTRRRKRFWKAVVGLGLFSQLAACSYAVGALPDTMAGMPQTTTQTTQTTQASGDENDMTDTAEESTPWTARTIPMPHLRDHSLYVSNPDNVVSQQTEQRLNAMLGQLDDSLNIESAMVIVNHVENKDIFRFAQDIFDIYKVGKSDHGLVVVLAYKDHLARIHTGWSLESELTDAESSRLQRTYLVPYMKAEQPDSGMLALTEAICNTLLKKDLPIAREYVAPQQDSDDPIADLLMLNFFFAAGWLGLLAWLSHRYGKLSGRSYLLANPFAQTAVFVGGFGGGGGGSDFGGGGFSSGGGFSGGGSGGGGATSSW